MPSPQKFEATGLTALDRDGCKKHFVPSRTSRVVDAAQDLRQESIGKRAFRGLTLDVSQDARTTGDEAACRRIRMVVKLTRRSQHTLTSLLADAYT